MHIFSEIFIRILKDLDAILSDLETNCNAYNYVR